MINIEAQIFSPIAEAVKAAYAGASVTGEYVRSPGSFPHVSVVETDNYTAVDSLDSSDTERVSVLTYEVNVYSNRQSGKKSECREIMDLIDGMMYTNNFTRLAMTPVPNYEDATIYRITARYRAATDGTNIYRIG